MKKKRVLIVDDNRDNILTIELLLEDLECCSSALEILSANNGKEAVDIIERRHIDLVFMDIMMPVMDGIEATKAIREKNSKVMIIAISALDDEESKRNMLSYGCEDYIRKPLDSNVFKKRVKNYIELIELRESIKYDNNAKNLFTKNVHNRELIFRINSKPSLAEYWEYFLTDTSKKVDDLSDCVRIIYALGAFLIAHKVSFNIVAEENPEELYFTIDRIDLIGEITIKNILLKHYDSAIYVINSDKISFKLKKTPEVIKKEIQKSQDLSDDDRQILRKTHTDKITAQEYVENTPINIMGKIEELEEEEDGIDIAILEFEKNSTVENIEIVGELFFKYALVIEELVEFRHLAYALESFSKMLKELEPTKLTNENNKKLVLFLTNILADLTSWRKTIFVEMKTLDIHYLDSSLLSSCLQVEMIFEQKNVDDGDGELELF